MAQYLFEPFLKRIVRGNDGHLEVAEPHLGDSLGHTSPSCIKIIFNSENGGSLPRSGPIVPKKVPGKKRKGCACSAWAPRASCQRVGIVFGAGLGHVGPPATGVPLIYVPSNSGENRGRTPF